MPVTWVTPRTWANGPLDMAALNTDVRDNMTFVKAVQERHGMTSPDTVGRLLSAGYGAKLTAGSFTATDGSEEGVNFTGFDWRDDASMWAASPNPGQWVCPPGGDGRWAIVGNAKFAGHATNSRQVWLQFNGDAGQATSHNRKASAGGSVPTYVSTPYNEFVMAAGQYVRLRVLQNSGTNLSVDSAWLLVRRVAV